MILYFVIFGLVLLLSLFDLGIKSQKNKGILILILSIIFILFASIRWEVGTDWDQYLWFFNIIDKADFGKAGHEFLYEVLLRIAKFLFGTYTGMLFLTAFIIISLTFRTIYKYSIYPILSILVLFAYSINASGFGYRQDIAIAITFFSFKFIYERKLIKFLVCILFATLFHQTAIIFTVAYWIYSIKWTRKYLILLIVSTVIGFFIMNKLDFIAGLYTQSAQGKLDYYLENKDETFGGGDSPVLILIRGIANRFFLLFLPLLIIFTKKNEKVEELKKLYNIFLFGFLFFLVFGSVAVVFLRFTRYFDIFQILVIPLTVYLSPPKHRVALILLLLTYFSIKFSVVILNDKNIYVPYQTIFD